MRISAFVIVSAALASPLVAGDLHGTVACKGGDCAAAVVYVDTIAGKTFPAPKDHFRVDQANLMFHPAVSAVLTGTTIDFTNSDQVVHNVFSPDKCADKFNLGTWPPGEKRSHTFSKDCFVTLLCISHPEMEGYVAVLPTPYFTVAGADGGYRIADVPDGSYTVKVWHPKLAPGRQAVTVAGSTELNLAIGH